MAQVPERAADDGSATTRRARRQVVVTLAVGIAVLAIGVAATLAQSARRRVGTNDVNAQVSIGPLVGGGVICQHERIPAGTGALRVSLQRRSAIRPTLATVISRRSVVLARGSGPAAWERATVTIPISPVLAREAQGRICIRLTSSDGNAQTLLVGRQAGPADAATVEADTSPIRLRFEYLTPTARSWWSFAPTVAERIGFGHAWSSAGVAVIAALLTLSSIAVGAWQLIRTAR